MNIQAFGLTDVGKRRESNEDAFLVLNEHRIYAVADGLGGHVAGEVASALAVGVLKKIPRAAIDAELIGTHQVIHQLLLAEAARTDRRGMATTLTAVAVVGQNAHVAHVGDSALYLVRDGKAERLTDDQTAGGIAEKRNGSKASKPMYSILMNCIGNRPESFHGAQNLLFKIKANDVLVLCSDGLTNYIENDQQIVACGANARSVEEYAKTLVQHAMDSGGSDNITVIVAHCS